MSRSNNKSTPDSILDLTEAGQQQRVKQIFEKRERASTVISQNEQFSDDEIYSHVRSYVMEFEPIAAKQDFTDFLQNTQFGQITSDDVNPLVKEREPPGKNFTLVGESLPRPVIGAMAFIDLDHLYVQVETGKGELSSGTEQLPLSIPVPERVSTRAYRVTERFRANIGLEIEPGELDVSEMDPV